MESHRSTCSHPAHADYIIAGLVIPFATSALPESVQEMAGAVSYFAKSYITQVAAPNFMVSGELVVVCTDQATAKAYNFTFGTANNGRVCFAGQFKDFPAHRSTAATRAPVALMFGHVQIEKEYT